MFNSPIISFSVYSFHPSLFASTLNSGLWSLIIWLLISYPKLFSLNFTIFFYLFFKSMCFIPAPLIDWLICLYYNLHALWQELSQMIKYYCLYLYSIWLFPMCWLQKLAYIVKNNLKESSFLFLCSQNKPGIPRSASGRPLGKPPTSRGHVKHFKKKGKKGGKPDLQYDLIVNIDLVNKRHLIATHTTNHFGPHFTGRMATDWWASSWI